MSEIVAHEDTAQVRRYSFTRGGRQLEGQEIQTACGLWLSGCVDDPNYPAGQWRCDREDDRPTCPRCVEASPYDYPGMLLIVRGGLGIPQIVQVRDEQWVGVYGIGKDRVVALKTVCAVLSEGDVIEDLGLVVRDRELCAIRSASDE